MKMLRLNIQLPSSIKAKLDSLRKHGYTASGYIRGLLEDDLRYREEGWQRRKEVPEFRDLAPWKSGSRSHGRKGSKKP